MKKLLLLVSMICATFAMSAQEEKAPINQELSQELSAIQTAMSLAKLGYDTYSPTALVEAARILAVTEYYETELEKETSAVVEVEEKDNALSFNPTKFLADAKEMAGKDKTLLALIKNTEKIVEEALKTKGTVQQRNAVDGPYYVEDRVYANSTESYTCKFWANELAEVIVVGDGDTDLDLYIYDANGNLITKDEDYSDTCLCKWVPAWTGTFVIKIVNRGGVYNDFVLATN